MSSSFLVGRACRSRSSFSFWLTQQKCLQALAIATWILMLFALPVEGFQEPEKQDPEKEPPSISKTEKLIQETIVPSYRQNLPFALEMSLKKLAARINDGDLERIDQELKKHEVEPLGQLFLSVRKPKILFSDGSAAPTSSAIELRLVLESLYADAEQLTRDVKKEVDFVDREPETFPEFEFKLRRLAELGARMEGLQKQAAYIENLRKHGKRDYRKHLEKEGESGTLAAALAGTDTQSLQKKLSAMRLAALEDELVTRIFRLENATSELANRDASKRNQLEAGMVVAVDGAIIPVLLERHRSRFRNRDLMDEELPQWVSEMVTEAKRDHGHLIELGGRLSVGMTHWLQGRYGSASSFGGLVKLPYTMNAPNAQGELFMPPLPLSRRIRNQTIPISIRPALERRHVFVSAYPYRQFDCHRMVPYVPTGPGKRPAKTGPKPKDEKKSGYVVSPAKSHIGKPSQSHIGTPSKSYRVRPASPYFIAPAPLYYDL